MLGYDLHRGSCKNVGIWGCGEVGCVMDEVVEVVRGIGCEEILGVVSIWEG